MGFINAIALPNAGIAPVPLPKQHRPLRPAQRQRRRQQQQQQPALHQTSRRSSSGSTSPPTNSPDSSSRRPLLGHSRTSSGSHASRSVHESFLQTDRPAAGHHKSAAVASPVHAQFHPPPAWISSPASPSVATNGPNSLHRPLRQSRHVAIGLHGVNMNAPTLSAESVSSASGTTIHSARTNMTSDAQGLGDNSLLSRPFIQRNGRTYLNDPALPYPLPSDLTELHRQSLRTLLLIQMFGAPVCSPSLSKKPPRRVLEIGCGSGFWSMMCHRYFKGLFKDDKISFTGIDIAPVSPGSANLAADATQPDREMNWEFVNHDIRQMPWPFSSEEFDLIMVKDMSLAVTHGQNQDFIDEYLRLLRPGGTVEIWESDHLIRMLRPHVPGSASTADEADEQEAASSLGAYVMSPNTPMSAPLNPFLVEYNTWLTRAFEIRDLSAVPCAYIGPVLLQESETLTEVRSRRLAIPLSEVRWEREGVGGILTRDGTQTGEAQGKEQKSERTLAAGQIALRKTALLTVVQQVQALEPILREAGGKSQDEWDVWLGKMMGDLMSENGASWGECLEVGAFWARKRKNNRV